MTSEPDDVRGRRRIVVRYSLRLGVTVVIVALLYSIVGWSDVVRALAGASIPWLVLMYGSRLLRQFIDAAQLRYLLSRVEVDVTIGRVFLASQLASLYSLILPGELAASTAKWANLAEATQKRSLVLNAMAYTKFLFLAVPLAIGSVALAVDNPLDTAWIQVIALALLFALLSMMLLLYHPRLGSNTEKWLRGMSSHLPAGLEMKFGYLLDSLARLREIRGRDHAVMAGFMLASSSMGVLRFWSGIQALHVGVPLLGVLWVIAFITLGRMLPITIANVGVREGLLVVALAAFDVPADQAVALGALAFSTTVMLAIIGAAYQTSRLLGWTTNRE